MLLLVRVELDAQAVTQPALRAAFLYNFAKFTEWPPDTLPTGPLTLCVLDDSAGEGALSELVGNSTINGRTVTISRNVTGARLRNCHLLYVGEPNASRAAAILDELLGAPVLTVSNGDDFIRLGGIVGLCRGGPRAVRYQPRRGTARRRSAQLPAPATCQNLQGRST